MLGRRWRGWRERKMRRGSDFLSGGLFDENRETEISRLRILGARNGALATKWRIGKDVNLRIPYLYSKQKLTAKVRVVH